MYAPPPPPEAPPSPIARPPPRAPPKRARIHPNRPPSPPSEGPAAPSRRTYGRAKRATEPALDPQPSTAVNHSGSSSGQTAPGPRRRRRSGSCRRSSQPTSRPPVRVLPGLDPPWARPGIAPGRRRAIRASSPQESRALLRRAHPRPRKKQPPPFFGPTCKGRRPQSHPPPSRITPRSPNQNRRA